MVTLKQESIDDNEEALVPASRSLGSIQKVPSISDLSDPEASLGESLLFKIISSRFVSYLMRFYQIIR